MAAAKGQAASDTSHRRLRDSRGFSQARPILWPTMHGPLCSRQVILAFLPS
jgi:hypothetical protein